MNIAYYLKYRPQSLDDLVGQEAVKKTLLDQFQNNKLSHAYLFVGPRGTGKTSTARILAKMINCELVNRQSLIVNRKEKNDKRYSINDIPCNKCEICQSITDGSNLDLIEIDAASNRGIEDIRSLRDKIKLAPTNSQKKVYIIDEVHMLTPEAFNALLKTLEEPPKHALFILATTEIAKVPQTILSRVQRLDFKLATVNELLEVLEKIVKQEKINIDEQALKFLVKKSDGSFRDGIKLLDQISSITGKITAKSLEEVLRITQFDDLLLLIKNFSEKNSTQSLLNITKQLEHGADIKELMLSLMGILRDLVFVKHGLGQELVKPQFTEDKYEELTKVSGNFSNQEIIGILDILQKALEKLKFASILSLPLELAVVEICNDNSKFKIQNSKLEEQPKIAKEIAKEIESAVPRTTENGNVDILKIKEKWTFVLETIRPYNFSLEALLRSINITECRESTVYIEVPYSFHQRILEAPKNRELLEGVLSDILGRGIQVATILGSRPQRKEDVANVEVAQDDEIIRAAAEIFNSDTVN
ncbi:DNA polymerase III subunit gamma/tau [Patescibacteria group bacterium]|nr:DNA polymerase III subunit gamma/tau [Patescibacteria group bacterium]